MKLNLIATTLAAIAANAIATPVGDRHHNPYPNRVQPQAQGHDGRLPPLLHLHQPHAGDQGAARADQLELHPLQLPPIMHLAHNNRQQGVELPPLKLYPDHPQQQRVTSQAHGQDPQRPQVHPGSPLRGYAAHLPRVQAQPQPRPGHYAPQRLEAHPAAYPHPEAQQNSQYYVPPPQQQQDLAHQDRQSTPGSRLRGYAAHLPQVQAQPQPRPPRQVEAHPAAYPHIQAQRNPEQPQCYTPPCQQQQDQLSPQAQLQREARGKAAAAQEKAKDANNNAIEYIKLAAERDPDNRSYWNGRKTTAMRAAKKACRLLRIHGAAAKGKKCWELDAIDADVKKAQRSEMNAKRIIKEAKKIIDPKKIPNPPDTPNQRVHE